MSFEACDRSIVDPSTVDRPARVGRELLLVALTMAAYFGLRLVVEGERTTAMRNAERLIELEQRLGIHVERDLQGWVVEHDVVRWTLSVGYVWLHWPLLIAAMAFLTWRAPVVQARLRNALAVSGAVGVALFAVVPMAPPRFMPGFVSTVSDAARRHFLPYPLGWTNQVAAFPSYHVGWTLLACLAVRGVVASRWARMALAAAAMLVAIAVVATGNHYVLDSLTGAILALAAWWLVGATATGDRVHDDRPAGAVHPADHRAGQPAAHPAGQPAAHPAARPADRTAERVEEPSKGEHGSSGSGGSSPPAGQPVSGSEPLGRC